MDHLLNWIWQGVAVAVATFVALKLLDRSRAQARYLLCGTALLVVLALPLNSLLWPHPPLSSATIDAVGNGGPVLIMPNTWWTSGMLLIGLYGLWCAFIAVRLTVAWLSLRRALAATQTFPAATESRLQFWMAMRARGRRTRLVLSPGVATAAVLGCGSPVIAVSPLLLDRLDDDELDRVVIHEWAHVQRNDDRLNILHVAARAIAGWHPGVWWLERQLRVEREVACDEMAVAVTGNAKCYAACLTMMASLGPKRRHAASALGALSSPTLSARILRILSARPTRKWSALAAAMLAILVGVFSMAVVRYRPIGLARSVQIASTSPTLIAVPNRRIVAPALRRAPASSTRRATAITTPIPERRVRPTMTASAPPAGAGQKPADPRQDSAVAELVVEPFRASHLPESIAAPTPPPTSPAIDAHGPPGVAKAPAPPQNDAVVAPWTSAADAGVAIGRGTGKAGVATAGFFNRMGKKIARSF